MSAIFDGLSVDEKLDIQNDVSKKLEILESDSAGEDFKPSGKVLFDAKALQNRDRSRSTYVMQMNSMANNLDYSKVSISRDANSGAPMVFSRGITIPAKQLGKTDTVTMSNGKNGSRKIPIKYAVISAENLISSHDSHGVKSEEYGGKKGLMALNNGRTAGIKASYQRGNGEKYKNEMIGDHLSHLVSVKTIEEMPDPVLVRLFDEADLEGIKDVGTASNEQVGASLSSTEQGFSDAERISESTLSKFKGGDVSSADNREFVRSFIDSVGGGNNMVDSSGLLSSAGVKRIEAALIAKAYDDKEVLTDISETADSDLKSLGTAIKSAAGKWAIMRDAAKNKNINPDVDITRNLNEAVGLVKTSRKKGKSIYDLVTQVDAFSGSVSDITKAILSLLFKTEHYTMIRRADVIANALIGYAERALETSPDSDMFGFKASAEELIEQQKQGIRDKKQRTIFDSITNYLMKEIVFDSALELDVFEKSEIQGDILELFNLLEKTGDVFQRLELQNNIAALLGSLSESIRSDSKEDETSDALEKLEEIKGFMPKFQFDFTKRNLKSKEPEFTDIVINLHKTITNMPTTYGQDGLGDKAIAYLHYFKGGSDAWVTEKDIEKRQKQAFGLMSHGFESELGYIDIDELTRIGLELDFHWKPKTIGEIRGKKR